jgi:hypothetical protein
LSAPAEQGGVVDHRTPVLNDADVDRRTESDDTRSGGARRAEPVVSLPPDNRPLAAQHDVAQTFYAYAMPDTDRRYRTTDIGPGADSLPETLTRFLRPEHFAAHGVVIGDGTPATLFQGIRNRVADHVQQHLSADDQTGSTDPFIQDAYTDYLRRVSQLPAAEPAPDLVHSLRTGDHLSSEAGDLFLTVAADIFEFNVHIDRPGLAEPFVPAEELPDQPVLHVLHIDQNHYQPGWPIHTNNEHTGQPVRSGGRSD